MVTHPRRWVRLIRYETDGDDLMAVVEDAGGDRWVVPVLIAGVPVH